MPSQYEVKHHYTQCNYDFRVCDFPTCSKPKPHIYCPNCGYEPKLQEANGKYYDILNNDKEVIVRKQLFPD